VVPQGKTRGLGIVMQKTIGVIGNGFVGNAVAKGFEKHLDVLIYDLDENRSTHSYEETLQSDFVFVCLPTPMVDAEGGRCNLSILDKFFKEASTTHTNATFIIKSTVPVGTTDRMCELYPHMKIVHNPEFLTAANAEQDFINADRHVVGGDLELAFEVGTLYESVFPEIPVYTMRSKESECVKYFANCFLASKVMVFNEMKMLCNNLSGVNYERIMQGVCSDERIGNSHTFVPGPDGDYGFGGTCFPKDINSLINIMIDNGVDPLVLKSVWDQNKNYRKNWDWSDNKSAVLKESEV
jgi:UDPglucose 6-dehydrogenase